MAPPPAVASPDLPSTSRKRPPTDPSPNEPSTKEARVIDEVVEEWRPSVTESSGAADMSICALSSAGLSTSTDMRTADMSMAHTESVSSDAFEAALAGNDVDEEVVEEVDDGDVDEDDGAFEFGGNLRNLRNNIHLRPTPAYYPTLKQSLVNVGDYVKEV
jgi:hypothetical protein